MKGWDKLKNFQNSNFSFQKCSSKTLEWNVVPPHCGLDWRASHFYCIFYSICTVFGICFNSIYQSWRTHIDRNHSQTWKRCSVFNQVTTFSYFLALSMNPSAVVVTCQCTLYILFMSTFWSIVTKCWDQKAFQRNESPHRRMEAAIFLFFPRSVWLQPDRTTCVQLLPGDSTPWPPLGGQSFTSPSAEYVIRVVGNISFTPPDGSSKFQRRRLAQVWPPVLMASSQQLLPSVPSSPHSKKQIIIEFFFPTAGGESLIIHRRLAAACILVCERWHKCCANQPLERQTCQERKTAPGK